MPQALRVLLLLAASVVSSNSAGAADLSGHSNEAMTNNSGLTFSVVPFYGWVPGMKGTVGVFGTQAAVDVTPLDIVKNIDDFLPLLDGIYIGAGEVRYGSFGFLYDVFFLDVSVNQEIDGRFIKGALGVGFRQSTTTLAGTYRVMQSRGSHLDAVAGVRIWDIDVDVQVTTNITGSWFLSDGDRWVDPMIGIKGQTKLTTGWSFSGWALAGGFGVGSNFAWDVYGGLNYEVSKDIELSFGFRALAADYQNRNFVWDIKQYGPLVGATFKF
jgi:hypothetical protein